MHEVVLRATQVECCRVLLTQDFTLNYIHMPSACRMHEAELRASREECWTRDQELSAIRDKLTLLKISLEERRKDISAYKVGTV